MSLVRAAVLEGSLPMRNKVHRLETVRADGTVAEQERLVWRSRSFFWAVPLPIALTVGLVSVYSCAIERICNPHTVCRGHPWLRRLHLGACLKHRLSSLLLSYLISLNGIGVSFGSVHLVLTLAFDIKLIC